MFCLADPLEFGRDLNAARYKDGVRETPNAEVCHLLLQALHQMKIKQPSANMLVQLSDQTDMITSSYWVPCKTSVITACMQVADSKTVWGLYKQGCTLQVHQPQRFHAPLAAVCSGLEQGLGCLVGINAYLTPPSTQVTMMTPVLMLS